MLSHRPQEQAGKWQAFFSRLWYLLFPPVPDFFSSTPDVSDLSYDEKELERKVIARFARGNIRLQQGKYLTQEDVDEGLRRCEEYARKYGD